MVREKWFEKSGSRNLVREKWLTRKKIRVCRTTFLEPLFYTFLEKWLQIKCSNTKSMNTYYFLQVICFLFLLKMDKNMQIKEPIFSCSSFIDSRSIHGRLYRWTENSFPFFLYLKSVEISKKLF